MQGRDIAFAIAAAGGVVAASVFVLWFRTGYFYAEGDVAPFVRDGLRSEFGWQWTHQASGAGGPTYELVRGPELVFIGLARLLGGTEAMGQRLFFTAIFAFGASGVATFAARFSRRAWLVLLAGIAGVCNPFVMIGLANALPALAIGLVGWLGAVTCRAATGGRSRWLLTACLSVPLAYLVINPPFFALIAVWVVALLAVAPLVTGTGLTGVRRVAGMYARAVALALPLSVWWIVPTYVALNRSSGAGTMLAETNVQAWSWTQSNASIAATASLVGRWSWPDPRYHSGTWLAQAPWSWALWVLPLAALVAPFVARPHRRRTAWLMLAGTAVLVFVGKGLHPPLGSVNLWLYDHVPGFFLLREPVSKVGALLVPLELIAWVLAIDGLAGRLRRFTGWTGGRRGVAVGAMAVLIIGPAIAAVPMVTGEAVQAGTHPSARVALPPAWRTVARSVNASPLRGKALVLPLDDYYQVPTTWGYYGSDNVARQLLTRPVISVDPQAYIGDSETYSSLVHAVQTALVSGDTAGVPSLLRTLGVSHVIVRKDIDYDSAQRIPAMDQPDAITSGLADVSVVERSEDTSVADVWQVRQESGPVSALGGLLVAGSVPDPQLVPLLVGTPDDLAVVRDVPPGVARELVKGRALTVLARDAGPVDLQPGRWNVTRRANGESLYHVSLESPPGRAPMLVFRDAVTWQVGTTDLPSRPAIRIPVPAGKVVAIRVDGQDHELDTGSTVVRLDRASSVEAVIAEPARTTSFQPIGDCNRADSRTRPQLQLGISRRGTIPNETIKLRSDAHAACVSAPVDARPGDTLRVAAQVRRVSGAPPRMCLWLSGPDTCASLALSGGWYDRNWTWVRAQYTVPAGVEGAALFLYADEGPPNDRMTLVGYRAPQVSVFRDAEPIPTPVSPPPRTQLQVAAGTRVVGRVGVPTVAIGAPSAVGDCNRFEPTSLADNGITSTAIEDGVRLHAERHSACVKLPLADVMPAASYRFRFRFRVTSGGGAARACLVGADGVCQPVGPLSNARGWTTADVTSRVAEHASAGKLELYLYADTDLGPSTVEYRDIRIEPSVDESLTFVTAGARPEPVPSLAWAQDGPARYRVHVDDASGPFVLALSDSWSSDWAVKGVPPGARVEPLLIDGYRNGWAIDARGDLDLTLEYQPARWGRAALAVSASTAAVTVFTCLWFGARRRRLRRDARRDSTRPAVIPGPAT
jgi:arabinofuranan 3-O-arabinosyltransferase